MKRDMDLVRRILLDVEASERYVEARDYEDWELAAYHFDIMSCGEGQGGLIQAEVERNPYGRQRGAIAYGLTAKGHDWLDLVRDDETWRLCREAVDAKLGGSAPFAVWTALALSFATDETARDIAQFELGKPF